MALENAVPTAILVTQLQVAAEKLHSPTPEVKEMSSAIVVLRALWAKAVHTITRAVEAEVVALDIKGQTLQLLVEVAEWAATVAGLAKQAQLAQKDFVAYLIIIFQALALTVVQKKFLQIIT